jgi:hypothetical protein
MKKLLTVLFTVLLAVGWQWITLANRQKTLADQEMLWLGVVLTLALLLQQTYIAIADPAAPERARRAQPIAENYLRGLLAKYYEYVLKMSPAQQPSVRVNVMLPTSWFKLRQFLRIHYTATLPGFSYRNEELVLRWHRGQGVCGWAWKHGMPGLYDALRPGYDTAARKRSAEQARVAESLKSMVCEPIWYDGEIVGMLNLDSDAHLAETRFDDPRVREMVKAYADNLASVCFPDGVRHR